MIYHPLNEDEYDALIGKATDGHMGDEVVFPCNADPSEHVHVRRIGDEGEGLGGRLGVFSHSAAGMATIFLSAPEARVLAATILDIADELDGCQPLLWLSDEKPDAN